MQKYQCVQCKFQIQHCLRSKLTLYVTKLPHFFSLLKQNNLTFEDKRGVVVNKALQVVGVCESNMNKQVKLFI